MVAGLLVRSFARLTEVDPGFRPAGTLSLEVILPDQRYPEPRRIAFTDRVLQLAPRPKFYRPQAQSPPETRVDPMAALRAE